MANGVSSSVRSHIFRPYRSFGVTVVGCIKALRIRWLGHIERMREERMLKLILNAKIDSGSRRGRPRKGWIDDLESGPRSWKSKARNINEWKAVVRGAKVHVTGL